MKHHVVVEGMDGTGKSTLIQTIMEKCRSKFFTGVSNPYFDLHPRASSSVDGPVASLDHWVEKDVALMPYFTGPNIYDRHPLISEPIYGPVTRGKVPGKFNDPGWIRYFRNRLVHQGTVIIFCDPGWEVIQSNLDKSADAQMPGVIEKSSVLYDYYCDASLAWPGLQMRYDYTKTDIGTVLRNLRHLFSDMEVTRRG